MKTFAEQNFPGRLIAVEGLDAVRHAFDLVALPAQVESRQLDDVLLIVDHEDLLTGGYG